MSKSLPSRPHIEWLKKTAKQRLAEMRATDPSTPLNRAQLEVAKDYGFKSWRALKARVDVLSLDGQIVHAIVKGHPDKLAKLLDESLDRLHITGGTWALPLLHLAAEHGQLDCIDILLERGFNVHLRDKLDNATALHWAAHSGNIAIIQRLLQAGARIDLESDAHQIGVLGWTVYLTVNTAAADFLLSRGAQANIFTAVMLNRTDLVQRIVEQDGSQLGRRMSEFDHSRTPLHLAVARNLPEIVKVLVGLGADTASKDHDGKTPLNLSTTRTDKAIPETLIAAGADPKEQNMNDFESVIPILNVKNFTASIGYYVNKLGFEKKWDWGDPPTFGCVARGKVEIFFCEGAQGQPGMWLSIFMQDVDALYDEYKRSGAIIRQPPTNFPWGMREMNVEDLDGHRLRMGSEATGPAAQDYLNEEP